TAVRSTGLHSAYFMLGDAVEIERGIGGGAMGTLQKELLDAFQSAGAPAQIAFQLRQAYGSYADCGDDRRLRMDQTALALTRSELSANWQRASDDRRARNALSCLDDLCGPTIPPEYRARIASDAVSRIVLGRSDYGLEVHTYAHEPEEMTEALVQHGFHSVETAHEGCLCLDPSVAPAPLIHELHKDVFECVAWR